MVDEMPLLPKDGSHAVKVDKPTAAAFNLS